MDSEGREKLKNIVADALELPPARRAAFLGHECGADEVMRQEAESLLARSGSRVEHLAAELNSTLTPLDVASRAGERLGAYEIVREIGRGGMGAVYLARRADATFEKEVAIKLLKRGTDTDEVLRRFQAERQILARLEHPNVARLVDAGTTADGLPYFVLEYVHGVPITDFCAEQELNTRQRTELILQVCGAVHFAHQNLVVHRDLKPRNILVSPEGVPKLLDFGIAKLLSDEVDAVQMTVQGAQRLTPGYASPEQVRGEAITTASDVYSLGALSYELFTGKSPHQFSTSTPSPTELLRVIAEEEIPRSSLPTDLDNILRTALRKEPDRRYSGVTAFADDLRRYLNARPVRARPATLGYRARKFVARNKLGVAAAILVLATLLGGITATAWQARIAQRRFNDVRKLARAVVFDYHDLIQPLRGSTPVRERLVKDALEYLENLSGEANADRGLLREIGAAYEKIGKIQGNSYYPNLGDGEGALKSYRKSLEIRQRLLAHDPNDRELIDGTAKTHTGLGDVLYEIGDLRAALANYEDAIRLRESAVATASDDFVNRVELAEAYSRVADLKGFEHYSNLGDPAGGLAAARRAQHLLEPIYARDPDNRDLISRLSNVLVHQGVLAGTAGDIASALQVLRRGVAMAETLAAREPDSQQAEIELLAARHFLRYAIEDSGQIAEAIAQSRQIAGDLERLLNVDPKNFQFRRSLAVTYNALGKQLLIAGDAAAALEKHRSALALTEEMLAGNPNSTDKKADVVVSLWRLGNAQGASGDYRSALDNYRRALLLREPVLTAEPSNARARDDVASISAAMAKALAVTGDSAEAMEAFGKALVLAEEISARAPTNARLRARLASLYFDLGNLHRELAQPEAARQHLTRSLTIWNELRDQGKLFPIDAAKPDQVAREIALGDEALVR